MAAPTYRVHALVLRKTKLGEADVIVTMLAQDGSQLRAVAKGARKPSSTFSSRLELYSEVELLCARTSGLDIVKEARLIEGHDALRTSIERSSGAACASELLGRIAQENLSVPHLFDMTCSALASLGRCEVQLVPAITAAHLLKAFAFAGLRPSLRACALCGGAVAPEPGASSVRFSAIEGGVVCSACAARAQTTFLPRATCQWADALLHSSFADIEKADVPLQAGIDALQLCQQWVQVHVGASLKSVRFLLTAGLFS